MSITANTVGVKLSSSVFPSQRLLLSGWRQGKPGHITHETEAIDRQTCRSMRCPKCRRLSLTYRAFHKGYRYAAVGDCPNCGAEQEI